MTILTCAACGRTLGFDAADLSEASMTQTAMDAQNAARAFATVEGATSGVAVAVSCTPRPAVTPSLARATPEPAEPSPGAQRLRAADGMTMVFVPSGEFEMGSSDVAVATARALCADHSPEADLARAVCTRSAFADEMPQHPVTLEGFWIDRTEVTNRQYHQCVESGACEPPVHLGSMAGEDYFAEPRFEDYPVIWVRWDQAEDYCRWSGGRLPTEAEWEYAARGPEGRLFPWGDAFDPERLNYCDRRCPLGPNDAEHDDGYAETSPVGSYPLGSSWCGALDMAGNVREWVSDWYGPYPASRAADPAGPSTGGSKIPRGGSWLDLADNLRSTNRGANALDYSEHKVGIRCVVPASAPFFSAPEGQPEGIAEPD